MRSLYGLIAVAAIAVASAPAVAQQTPAQVADELLAADRDFSKASAGTDAISGISAMFADDVVMPVPGKGFVHGKAEVVAGLRANPANATVHAEWTPVRAGISGDGLHGFTTGYMTMQGKEGPPRRAKYLAYWVKGTAGWRVANYKRGPQGEGVFSTAVLPPVLPPRINSGDPGKTADYGRGLDAAERAFSDEAQKVGLGPAFCTNGAPSATNLGGPGPVILSGVDTICKEFSDPEADKKGSPLSWAPDAVLVASSGDFGITWGMLHPNGPVPAGQPAGIPYSTVWVRAAPDQPWKYIAE